jgi:hypothetical protein
LNWVQRSLASDSPLNQPIQVATYMISAMAHYQLHKTSEAKAALAAGIGIAQVMPAPDNGGWDNYYCDWIIAHVLIREAKELIQGAALTLEDSPE